MADNPSSASSKLSMKPLAFDRSITEKVWPR